MTFDYDLVVLGSGPAGEKGGAQAAYFGKRVAIVEREPRPGGAAVHTGTLPSKTLRESALFLSGYHQRELYGLSLKIDPDVAMHHLLARVDSVRAQEVERIESNLDTHRIERVPGDARLLDPHTVEVGCAGRRRCISAEFILIATGSTPHRPGGIDFDDPAIDDSDTILAIDRLPRRLVVLGAGVIGAEYASTFAALDVVVTVVDARDELLPALDRDIAGHLRAGMEAIGVRFALGRSLAAVRRSGSALEVRLDAGGPLRADRLLVAAGRSGRTAGLGLEALGVATTSRGFVEVDADFRSTVPSILAAGDVIGPPALASTAMEQGRVAVNRAFGFEYKQHVASLLPQAIYTIPEVSTVGLSEDEARREGRSVVCGSASYERSARGKIIGDREGLVKLVFDRDSRALLGAQVVGERASELVHIGQAIITLGGTVDTLIEMVFNYPTLSESYKYAAYDALGAWDPGPGARLQVVAGAGPVSRPAG
jgi:NAD(P) transhydrogenase